MSSQSALSLSSGMLPNPMAAAKGRNSIDGLSMTGAILFLIGLLVIASGFTRLRPVVGGLAVHPYLFLSTVVFPFVVLARIHLFPSRLMIAFSVFIAMYYFSVFNGGSFSLSETVKAGTAVTTIVTCALLVRKRGDFVAGALGLGMAVAILAVHGLQDESNTHAGVEAIQGANKNSFSLFALPTILLAGYIAISMNTIPVYIKAALVVSCVPSLIAIFMSGNRSGYLGAVLVALMLFWNRRGKGLILVCMLAGVVAFGIKNFGSAKVLDEKLKQTVAGTRSDTLRRDITLACIQIAFENPIIGVGPQTLGFEIARRIPSSYRLNAIDSHNVFGHIIAASGLICFAALIACGRAMWTWKPAKVKVLAKTDPFFQARSLLRMLVILWVVRGIFTREILYNPSFNICLGLTIGYCMLMDPRLKQPTVPMPLVAPQPRGLGPAQGAAG